MEALGLCRCLKSPYKNTAVRWADILVIGLLHAPRSSRLTRTEQRCDARGAQAGLHLACETTALVVESGRRRGSQLGEPRTSFAQLEKLAFLGELGAPRWQLEAASANRRRQGQRPRPRVRAKEGSP